MKSVFHRVIKFIIPFSKYFSEYFYVTFLHEDVMIQVSLAFVEGNITLHIIMHGIFMFVLWRCGLLYSRKF